MKRLYRAARYLCNRDIGKSMSNSHSRLASLVVSKVKW